jgi:hypothetical protein
LIRIPEAGFGLPFRVYHDQIILGNMALYLLIFQGGCGESPWKQLKLPAVSRGEGVRLHVEESRGVAAAMLPAGNVNRVDSRVLATTAPGKFAEQGWRNRIRIGSLVWNDLETDP